MERQGRLVLRRFIALLSILWLIGCGADPEPIDNRDPNDRPDTSQPDPDPPPGEDTTPTPNTDTSDNRDDTTEETVGPGQTFELKPVFNPEAEGFYATPWPSDYRVTNQGTVDVTDLPNKDTGFLDRYVEELKNIKGFSQMPVSYVQFNRPLDSPGESLPSPSKTIESSSSVQLVNVSSANCGQRIPLRLSFDFDGDRFMASNLLKASPVPGFHLKAGQAYAFIVTKDVGRDDIYDVTRPEAFHRAFANHEGPDQLHASYRPLRSCLESPDLQLASSDIAVATVFTTQNPKEKTRALVQKVRSDSVDAPSLKSWETWNAYSNSTRTVYRGTYETPIFQHGSSPYFTSGGRLNFNIQNQPTVARSEEVPFTFTVPESASAPLDVLVWEGGTGFGLWGPLDDRYFKKALENGFAVATFAPQFHQGFSNETADKRGPPSADARLHSFNYLNPAAGRTVFRQQVADTAYFTRVIAEQIEQKQNVPELDTEKFYYGGHSQGAIVGAMIAGTDPKFESLALNGVGGYFSDAILTRELSLGGGEPQKISSLLESSMNLERDVDHFHIIVQIAQLAAGAIDPLNYTREWRGWEDDETGVDIFISNGKTDSTTSTLQMNSLVIGADIPPIQEPGWEVDPYDLWETGSISMPVEQNISSIDGTTRTQAAFFNESTGHFTLQDLNSVSEAYGVFWKTAAEGRAQINIE